MASLSDEQEGEGAVELNLMILIGSHAFVDRITCRWRKVRFYSK